MWMMKEMFSYRISKRGRPYSLRMEHDVVPIARTTEAALSRLVWRSQKYPVNDDMQPGAEHTGCLKVTVQSFGRC